jgi:ADP-ribose pyrophosphatase YjhB (NUDIX family)
MSESRIKARELLLEDYRYLSDSFWKNEQVGETRVNWFIGIVTAVCGGLLAMTSSQYGPRERALNEWLLPKGHVEEGEGHAETALREVREETGVVARLMCLVGGADFQTSRGAVRAKYYLMEYLYGSESSESRSRRWLEYEDALKMLMHGESKYLLREAETRRRALAQRNQTPVGAVE